MILVALIGLAVTVILLALVVSIVHESSPDELPPIEADQAYDEDTGP